MTDLTWESGEPGDGLDALVRLAAEAGPAAAREALRGVLREHPETAARWLLLHSLLNEGDDWGPQVRQGLAARPTSRGQLLLKALDRLVVPNPPPQDDPRPAQVIAQLEGWLGRMARPESPQRALPEVQEVAVPVTPVPEAPHVISDVATQQEILARLEAFWHRLHRPSPVEEEIAPAMAAMLPDAAETVVQGASPSADEDFRQEAVLSALDGFLQRLRGEAAPGDGVRPAAPGLAALEGWLQRLQGRGEPERDASPPALAGLLRFHAALLRWKEETA